MKKTQKKSESKNQPLLNLTCCEKKESCKCMHGCQEAFYVLGFIGAVVYYISTATTFWGGVLGVLKALVWPAFLVYELLRYLSM